MPQVLALMCAKLCMHTGLGSLLCVSESQCVLTVTVLGVWEWTQKETDDLSMSKTEFVAEVVI